MRRYRGLLWCALGVGAAHLWLLAQPWGTSPAAHALRADAPAPALRAAWTAARATPASPAGSAAPARKAPAAPTAQATARPTGLNTQPPPASDRPAIPLSDAAPSRPPEPAPAEATPTDNSLATAAPAPAPAPEPKTDTALAPPAGALADPHTSAAHAATPAGPVKLADSARLLYDVTGLGRGVPYRASGELVWERGTSAYSARLEVRVLLLSRSQTSVGQLNAHGLVPERFGDKSRSERAAHFDWPGARVRFSANTPDAALSPGTQDRLSVFLQLAGWLAALPAPPTIGQSWTIATVAARDIQPWTFRFEGLDTLDLPAGRFETWKLRRASASEHDQTVDIWFAPALQHLPVRLRITQSNGDEVDQRLREHQPLQP